VEEEEEEEVKVRLKPCGAKPKMKPRPGPFESDRFVPRRRKRPQGAKLKPRSR